MKLIILIFITFFMLFGCSSSPSEDMISQRVQETLVAIPSSTPYPTQTHFPTFTLNPTYTVYPTYTSNPTYTNEPTRVIVITATSSPTPKYTPTETLTPTITPTFTNSPTLSPTATLTPTINPQTVDKNPGFYLVGVDIASGLWRSLGTGASCYWELTGKQGEIIANHFGLAGGTVNISPYVFQVQFDSGCGTWQYLQP